MYAPQVYEKAGQALKEWISDGYFIRDSRPCYYIYEQVMDGRAQTGIVACASVNDYVNNVIKKHENTREAKEQDRIRHISACQAQTGPIFLAYRHDPSINEIMAKAMAKSPVYDFITPDNVSQRVWIIDDAGDIQNISQAFANIPNIYIADGHHRAASAVKVSLMRRKAMGLLWLDSAAAIESDYFLSVLFPDDQLKIMAYNRVVKDLTALGQMNF